MIIALTPVALVAAACVRAMLRWDRRPDVIAHAAQCETCKPARRAPPQPGLAETSISPPGPRR